VGYRFVPARGEEPERPATDLDGRLEEPNDNSPQNAPSGSAAGAELGKTRPEHAEV
jgi:hypothetical protein